MATYCRDKIRAGYWSYCYKCDDYTYTPADTRQHGIEFHGYTDEHVMRSWPDESLVVSGKPMGADS